MPKTKATVPAKPDPAAVKVPPPRVPPAVKKLITSLKIDKERTMITVVDQVTVFEDLKTVRRKTMLTQDSLYPVALLREWEHDEMFRTPSQWCLYEALMRLLEVRHVSISASSCLAALNIVKEAVIYLANSSSHNSLFRRWVDACYELFERHNSDILVSNRVF